MLVILYTLCIIHCLYTIVLNLTTFRKTGSRITSTVITGRQKTVLYDRKVVRGMRFGEPIMSRKNMLQQYLISIDARLRSRNSTVSVKAESAWLHETQLSRNANLKEWRLFMDMLNNSDIL